MNNTYIFNEALYIACKSGNITNAQTAINKGATNYNEGLYGACMCGSVDIARLMVKKGANKFNYALWLACYHGHINVVLYILSLNPHYINEHKLDNDTHFNLKNLNINHFSKLNLNYALNGACAGGHLDIVKLMIKNGANDLNDALFHASTHAQIEVADYLINNGVSDFELGKIGTNFPNAPSSGTPNVYDVDIKRKKQERIRTMIDDKIKANKNKVNMDYSSEE